MIDMTKYKFYSYIGKPEVDGGKRTVCAASTYAGKTVKGYAKADPRDSFDMEAGKRLAAARCNAKISEKRLARAEKKKQEAYELVRQATEHLAKMQKYFNDTSNAADAAEAEVKRLLTEM